MFVLSCCIATTTSYCILTRCQKKYHVVMSGHTIALILWLPSIKVSNSPSWYTFELYENKSSERLLSEGEDFQAHSDLIHGNGSPNECSSRSAASMIIAFALISQVGWMRASVASSRVKYCLDKALVWLRDMRKPPTISVPIRQFTDKQSPICNSSSPTPPLPKPKRKDKKTQNQKEML